MMKLQHLATVEIHIAGKEKCRKHWELVWKTLKAFKTLKYCFFMPERMEMPTVPVHGPIHTELG